MSGFTERLLAVFLAVDKVCEALFNEGRDGAAVPVHELIPYVAQTFGEDITFELVAVSNEHLLGQIKRFEGNRSVIYLVDKGSIWITTVACKETCHIVLDQPGRDFQKDAEDTLERLGTTFLEYDAPENFAIHSEDCAEIMMWELLYPHEHRRKDLQAIRDDASPLTLAHVSAKYRLPESVITDILSEPYLAMCDRYWKLVLASKVKAAE